jgi:glutamyl-tRNA reductase
MKFSITGVSHKSAPVEVRERLAFDERSLGEALDGMKRMPGIHEGMILSTCNRVEVAIACDEGTNGQTTVDRFLAETRHVDPEWMRRYSYRFDDREAIRHLFRVAASLDSMVVGEPQILGQLKSAYTLAKDHGVIDSFLDALLMRAFSVAKRVRTETEIGASAVSVSYAAVELAREIFGSLKGKTVLLVGAGKMSEASARHLRRSGVAGIIVTNRTRSRAEEVARVFDGRIVDYDRFLSVMPEVDIVITSSGAPHYILTRDDMRRIIALRKNAPVFVIDIAVPRNVEPTVNEIDNVFLYDIDDLQKVVDTNMRGRKGEAEEAEQIITEEVERMMTKLKSRDVVPTIVGLQEQLETMRQAEILRFHNKLGPLTKAQEDAVDQLTRSLINKIAHGPISELRKQSAQPEGHHFISAIRKVFRLVD